MRYAIYFTPERDDPLTRVAANWLGRDPFTGAAAPAPAIGRLSPAEIAFHTAAARRYGFHATLKAPFRLAGTETEASLIKAMEVFAEGRGASRHPASGGSPDRLLLRTRPGGSAAGTAIVSPTTSWWLSSVSGRR